MQSPIRTVLLASVPASTTSRCTRIAVTVQDSNSVVAGNLVNVNVVLAYGELAQAQLYK